MLTRSYINKQIDEIGISQWCWTYRSIKFSVPRKQRSTKNSLYLLWSSRHYEQIEPSKWMSFSSKIEEWIPCVNLFWLPSGYLQGFPVDFLLLSESWSFYLPFSSPPLLLLRCCSLEIFVETAVTGGNGPIIVPIHRYLHSTGRIRALASKILEEDDPTHLIFRQFEFYVILNIVDFRVSGTTLSYRARRYGRLDTLNSKIRPLFQILDTEPGWCKNSGGGAAGGAAAAGAGGGVQFY